MAPRLTRLLVLLSPTNLVATLILIALGAGGVTWWRLDRRAKRVERQRAELESSVGKLTEANRALRGAVASLEAECVELRGFVERLTSETRVADVRVLASHPDPEGVPLSTVEFAERLADGRAPRSRVFAVRGREVYFDALVIRFDEDRVKVGDPLCGKSLHLFRRAFGSAQEPRDGPLLASQRPDGVPDAYRSGAAPSDFERRLWQRFWHWAAHPDEAAREGVRVAQIEAVGIRPEVGASYRIALEHDGGLTIRRVVPQP